MTTNKTIKSKYQPKQTNVTWVDLSGKTPVEKHFINGRWRPIGGGGSTNPGYDVTKQTVTLFNDTIETQQVEDLYEGVVLNVDFDLIAGETYTVVFDGISYDVKAIPSPFQDGFVILGEIDNVEGQLFETYPFNMMCGEQGGIKGMGLYTNTEGSHTVEIKHEEETVTTTPAFESMIQGIVGSGSASGCKVIYPDSISYVDNLYSQYNKAPEAGNIYFIPLKDVDSTQTNHYLYPVYIEEYNKVNGSGIAIIIGTPIINDNNTLTILPFNSNINPSDSTLGLCIEKFNNPLTHTIEYRLNYDTKYIPEG